MVPINRLLIGPGPHTREGWKSLDANPAKGADFIAAIPPLPAEVKAVLWDEVEWIHGVGSLYPWDAAEVLAELHSVMVPDGKLILEQPDFWKAVERVEWLFGDPSLRDPLHMNRWCWSPQSLAAVLAEAGFIYMEVHPAQHHNPARDFRLEAYA